MKANLDKCWHRHCPSTKEDFSIFMDRPIAVLQETTWEDLMTHCLARFGLISLGGGMRFPGSEIQVMTFTFRSPITARMWTEGLPGKGSLISAASESNIGFIGRGKTVDQAALAAILVFWEITYRRAMG